ncbi:MAG: DUF4142 domain-containing protein [Gemmatimonadaceae bacterium]
MRIATLVAAALALGTLACRRDEANAAVDTTTAAFDTGVSLPGGDTASRDKAAAAPAPTPVTSDGKALGAFIAASRHEIQHGKTATEKGSTQAVRDLGRSISRDHDDFVQRARALGERLSIAPAAQAGDTSIAGHPDAMSELRSRSGVEFDRAFLEHEVDYHRWLIDAVNRTMLPEATKEELRTFLQQSIPAFEAHMKGAQDLLAKLGR